MPLKLFGALLLALAGLGGGLTFARRLAVRRDFLSRLIGFLSSLTTALRYRGDDIYTSVNSCGELFFVEESVSNSFETAWKECVSDFPKKYRLSKRDYSLLEKLGSGLGTTDIEGQLEHIEYFRALFERQLGEAREDVARKSKLYQTLGLFIGVSAALMIL